MPQKFEYPLIIHPATLDSMFQMVFTTLTGDKESSLSVMVPKILKSLYISCSIGNKAGDELHGHSVGNNYSHREAEASIVFSDPEWKQPQVIVTGLRCTALSAMTEGVMPTGDVSASRKLCLECSWKEGIDLMTHEQAKALLNKVVAAAEPFDSVVTSELELAAYICWKLKRYSRCGFFMPSPLSPFHLYSQLLSLSYMRNKSRIHTPISLGYEPGRRAFSE